MPKRQYPGFPKTYNFDYSMGDQIDVPKTYRFITGDPVIKECETGYVTTTDGILQILVANNVASFIDGGANPTDIDAVLKNKGSLEMVNLQFADDSSQETEEQNDGEYETIAKKAKRSVEIANYQNCICHSLKILKNVSKVRLVLVSHVHPDHFNLLKDLLKEKEVECFLLGGAPCEYRSTLGMNFLQFISEYCIKHKETKVFLTILDDDISSSFRNNSYIADYFNNDEYLGLQLTDIHKYIPYMNTVDKHSKLSFAKYLQNETMDLTIFGLNASVSIQSNVLSYDATNLDSQCMVIQAKINNYRITFTGDSNVKEQIRATERIKLQLPETEKPTDILVVSRNSQFGEVSNKRDVNTIANSLTSIQKWAPDIFCFPVSNNECYPKENFIKAASQILNQSLEVDEHEIIFFSDNKNFTSSMIEVPKEDPKLNANVPVRRSLRLEMKKLYEKRISMDEKLQSWLQLNGFNVMNFEEADDKCFRVFLRTKKPIITINKTVSIQFTEDCRFYQS